KKKNPIPQTIVENPGLIQEYLAADNFVARGGVSRKLDTAHEELFLLIELHGEVDYFFLAVDIGQRSRHKVDVAVLPVQLLVILERLADLFCGKNVALFQGKGSSQKFGLDPQDPIE